MKILEDPVLTNLHHDFGRHPEEQNPVSIQRI